MRGLACAASDFLGCVFPLHVVVKRENGGGGGEGIQAERMGQNSSVSVVYLSLPLSLFSPLNSYM